MPCRGDIPPHVTPYLAPSSFSISSLPIAPGTSWPFGKIRAGVPLNQALNMVAEAVDNAFVAGRIREMRSGVERGESLLRTAAASQLFTPLVMQMFAVGEETGQVDELMQEAAEFYEREVDYDLKTLTARIEPILLVIVACMVLVLALGIFTPMWDMMRAVRGH